MNFIIVDDEPIARRGIENLASKIPSLQILGSFENAEAAGVFMKTSQVDLVFLDIRMPGINGIEFAKTISANTLVIFTTAFAEFALDSYEVDAVDYLVKPIKPERFEKAVEKAVSYHTMLLSGEDEKNSITQVEKDYIFVKSDRRFFRVNFGEILFVEALKDYVVIQLAGRRLITHMNLKNFHLLLPQSIFLRVNRSYIINREQIDSFSNNDILIGEYEVEISNFYRDSFFEAMMNTG